MTHFLDELPFDHGRPESRELRDLLASTIHKEQDLRGLLARAEIPAYVVNFQQANLYVWHDALTEARGYDRLRALIEAIASDPRWRSIHGRLAELTAPEPIVEARGGEGGLSSEPAEDERIIGDRSTLVDICFLEGGLRVAPAVARLRVACPSGTYYGTGFLVGPAHESLLLTNHHVLFDSTRGDARATRVEVWFSYERAPTGLEKQPCIYEADPSTITGDKELDWAVIRIPGPLKEAYPRLPLAPSRPPEVRDRVYIIQHPGGEPKQIGMHQNLVEHVDDRVVQYLTDTKAGSSGSPVFDERWEVVALHHRWVSVPQREGAAPRYRNEGIRIEHVQRGLIRAGVITDA